MEKKMADYSLTPNHLTSDPNDYFARIRTKGSIDQSDLVADMLKRGTTLNQPELEGTVKLLFEACVDRLVDGYSVHTPMGDMTLSLKGVFNGMDDSFDSTRHIVDVSISSTPELRQSIKSAVTLNRVDRSGKRPLPAEFHDLYSGEVNGPLVAGTLVRLMGSNLKFDSEDETQGVFFIDSEGSETKIENIGVNKPRELIFNIPTTLTSGDYTIEVRAIIGKTVETGRLPVTLTLP